MGDPPPRGGSLVRGILAALLVVFLRSADAAVTSNEKVVAVVGAGECADCASRNIKDADAFEGLHVAINCKAGEGEYQIRGVGKLDKDGKFTVKLPTELVKEDGELKAECFAQLHGGAKNAPCPAAHGLEAAKLVLKSRDGGKHTFGTAGKLSFSSETCAAAFFWHHWIKPIPKYYIPKYSFPPKVYTPVYKPPLTPPVYQTPPTPVYTPPPVYSKPPAPVYKPPPVYTPPTYQPPTPVYKPPPMYQPTPMYKPPPMYQPTPMYKPPCPPVYIYKPPMPKFPPFPPVYMKPMPPFPQLPPKYFYPHPKFGYPPSYGWPPMSPYTYTKPKHPFFPPSKVGNPKP